MIKKKPYNSLEVFRDIQWGDDSQPHNPNLKRELSKDQRILFINWLTDEKFYYGTLSISEQNSIKTTLVNNEYDTSETMNDEDYNLFELDDTTYEYVSLRNEAKHKESYNKLVEEFSTYYDTSPIVEEKPNDKLTSTQLDLIEKWVDGTREYPLDSNYIDFLKLIKSRGYYFDYEKIELNRIRKDYMLWIKRK